MAKADAKSDCLDDPWDDTLLIKAYDNSIKLAREELARRMAISTSKDVSHSSNESNKLKSLDIENFRTKNEYKVGDYVRATYEDGIDYEAKILSIDRASGSCLLKYIGYENEQNIELENLIPSWGKKARRLQFAKAKLESTDHVLNMDNAGSKTSKRNKSYQKTIPPPPPMPPMLSTQNCEDSEHLSAMLMSWYMSGYYTGVYQGMQMAKSGSKNKKH
ncbi:survival motor neuron protein [Lucilia cuprina]|uniref:survival motor neuron protein n=1 Tax=Lucilia cuprina TaxID=7375 RepID=UPI001F066459|nr:survival motor neuron protein [Lucilia cuprina]